jgi:hypothetical protein
MPDVQHPGDVEADELVECELGVHEVPEDEIADCPAAVHCFDCWTNCGACVDAEVLEKRAEQAADRTDYLGDGT